MEGGIRWSCFGAARRVGNVLRAAPSRIIGNIPAGSVPSCCCGGGVHQVGVALQLRRLFGSERSCICSELVSFLLKGNPMENAWLDDAQPRALGHRQDAPIGSHTGSGRYPASIPRIDSHLFKPMCGHCRHLGLVFQTDDIRPHRVWHISDLYTASPRALGSRQSEPTGAMEHSLEDPLVVTEDLS